MATIKAPFNFVPLSSKVFFPDWADLISHDIPFEDGLSGVIELKITAQTPIFVRNGHTQKDHEENRDAYKSFSKMADDSYFIPGTSIKGAVRSVLEILSFGKMGKNQVVNQSFGLRDLSKSADGDFYREKIKTDRIHCGWLQLKNEEYYLDDCGLPWRISVESIDHKFGSDLYSFIQNNKNFKEDENRTAKKKYDLFGNHEFRQRFCSDEELREANKAGNRLFVKFDAEGDEGVIVFTGQPGERKLGKRLTKAGKPMMEGKFYEFVFPSKVERKGIPLDESLVKEFISVHRNSPDYKDFRKAQLIGGERIPVFFIYKEDDKTVEAIGLSYLFKYPAYNSIYGALAEDHLSDKRDLPECMFGDVATGGALKGRIMFGNAKADGECRLLGETPVVLATPNPSYYPLYLGDGQTWNSETIHVAGRKRYPTRNKLSESPKGTEDMANTMNPLDAGTVFLEKIRYHNLKRVELGALLSALLFHNEEGCFHSLGAGKPLGYGKVTIEVQNLSQDEIGALLSLFEDTMEKEVPNWKVNPCVTELFAMAKGIPSGRESEFSYMHMDTDREKNEFIKGRNAYASGEQLGYFSQIIAGSVPPARFVGNVQAAKERLNIEKILLERAQRKQSYEALLEEIRKSIEAGEFDLARSKMEEAKNYTVDESALGLYYEAISKKEMESKEKELADAQRQEAAQRQQAYAVPLAERIANASKFATLFGNVKSWMKNNGVETLSNDDMQALYDRIKAIVDAMKPKEREKMKGFGGDLDALVGPETAKQWFEDIKQNK